MPILPNGGFMLADHIRVSVDTKRAINKSILIEAQRRLAATNEPEARAHYEKIAREASEELALADEWEGVLQ